MQPRVGAARPVPFRRESGAIDVDLDGIAAEDVDSLSVEWPVPVLTQLTLIDTPGIGSLTSEASMRSLSFLTSDEEHTTPSDAVIYLLRHLHESDVSFLHAFHEEEFAQPSPVNCIAVLSRADEIAAGRLDGMESADTIAERYRSDPRLRRLVQHVVPVAGLLAQAGSNLREIEFRRLRILADSPTEATPLMLSADRFANAATPLALAAPERQILLDRLGLFGVRLAVDLLRRGEAHTATELADRLVDRSQIARLRDLLVTQFSGRRDTLKARSALLAVRRLVAVAPGPRSEELSARLEQIWMGAHEFVELRTLNALRRGEVELRPHESDEIERLLGIAGTSATARLGLAEDSSPETLRRELLSTLSRWRQREENPSSSLATKTAARVAVRTCEGLYATVSP